MLFASYVELYFLSTFTRGFTCKNYGQKIVIFCVLSEGFDCIDLGTKQKLEESKQHSFLASLRALQYFCAKMQQLQLFTALPALWLYCSVSLQLRENLAPPSFVPLNSY